MGRRPKISLRAAPATRKDDAKRKKLERAIPGAPNARNRKLLSSRVVAAIYTAPRRYHARPVAGLRRQRLRHQERRRRLYGARRGRHGLRREHVFARPLARTGELGCLG